MEILCNVFTLMSTPLGVMSNVLTLGMYIPLEIVRLGLIVTAVTQT